jgi:hypothetical protein
VTQPRVTCYRVGIRMNEPRMPALLVEHHRPGFYFRVLEEGEVGSGNEIVKVAGGPVPLTVAQTDALLYLPDHSRDQLQQALNIPALSPGWQDSFRAMLHEEEQGGSTTGNRGLSPSKEPPPAWPGFRRLRVTRITRESRSVTSLVLEPGGWTSTQSRPARPVRCPSNAPDSRRACRTAQLLTVRRSE